jgi:hypothetical protein
MSIKDGSMRNLNFAIYFFHFWCLAIVFIDVFFDVHMYASSQLVHQFLWIRYISIWIELEMCNFSLFCCFQTVYKQVISPNDKERDGLNFFGDRANILWDQFASTVHIILGRIEDYNWIIGIFLHIFILPIVTLLHMSFLTLKYR